MKRSRSAKCGENHIGNTPRSIMTKGTSTRRKNRLPGNLYGNFDPGDQDKLMITYERDPTRDYTMTGACGVIYQGDMHFFGGRNNIITNDDFSVNFEEFVSSGRALRKQHFKIETNRRGKMPKMTKMKDLDIGFGNPSCSSFDITSDSFPFSSKSIVILCFGDSVYSTDSKSCYTFDGKTNYIGDTNYVHYRGGLTNYKEKLIVVGGVTTFINDHSQGSELMERRKNDIFIWSVVEPNFQFERSYDNSLVGLFTCKMTFRIFCMFLDMHIRHNMLKFEPQPSSARSYAVFNENWPEK